ncbi:MAG: hypothetical protein LBI92_00230 [Azoarcus sp.]|jgi:hypothetical protein|nr:hypothetical protein [Azoarcus sp.]
MRYRLLFAVLLCLAIPMAFAQQPKQYDGYQPIVEDQEPNWGTATYSCPLSIKTGNGEFSFSGFRLSHAGDPRAELVAAPRKYIPYRFDMTEEFDLTCEYEGFDTRLVMPRLKGLTACGRNDKPVPSMACWTTDPYSGKK